MADENVRIVISAVDNVNSGKPVIMHWIAFYPAIWSAVIQQKSSNVEIVYVYMADVDIIFTVYIESIVYSIIVSPKPRASLGIWPPGK